MSKRPNLRIAVNTGGHSFEVINFHNLFRRLDGIDAYIQHIKDFSSSLHEVLESYDVLFYTWMLATPSVEGLPSYAG